MKNNRDFYQETFSQVRSSTELHWEDMEQKQPRRRQKLPLILAAVIALMAGLSTAGYASGWFGLRELVIREDQELFPPTPPADMTEDRQPAGEQTTPVQPPQTGDMISLSGYAKSVESLALAEWQAFLDSYDRDGAILEKIGNRPTGLTAPYLNYYTVYTQEMADTLESIAEKYDLALHTAMDIVDGEELARRLGGDFLGEAHGKSGAYIYENGTFQTDGDAVLEGHGLINYQLRREVKGTLGDVILNVSDVETYNSWQYETACGERVMLALGPEKALIFADYTACFVTVNVLAGTDTPPMDIFSDGPLSREKLEALADGIDFSVLKIVSEQAYAPIQEDPALPQEDWILADTGISEAEAQAFYCTLYSAVEEGRKQDVAKLIAYPRTVVTAEGAFTVASAEEFLPYYDSVFSPDLLDAMRNNQYDAQRADLFTFSWEKEVCAAGGFIRFRLENGAPAVTSVNAPATKLGFF